MKDERIEQVKNKIGSEMATIILCGVAVSFLIKTLVFNMSLQERMTEYLILILSPLYQFARMHMMKVSIPNKPGNKNYFKTLLIPISIVLGVLALSFLKNTKGPTAYNWQNPVILLFIYLLLFITTYLLTNKHNQQRAHKYEKEFDDDSNQ